MRNVSKIYAVHIERDGRSLHSKTFMSIKTARGYAQTFVDDFSGKINAEYTRAGSIRNNRATYTFDNGEVIHLVIHRVTDPYTIKAYLETL